MAMLFNSYRNMPQLFKNFLIIKFAPHKKCGAKVRDYALII